MADQSQVLDLDHYVPHFLAVIGNAVSRGASRLYLREFGVGIIEWRIMANLAVRPNDMANHICEMVGLDKAAVSRSLQGMVKAGFVTATPSSDPRRQTYALTPDGLALHNRIMPVARQREQRLLDGMSQEDIATLLTLLGRMEANLPKVNEDDYEIPGKPDPA